MSLDLEEIIDSEEITSKHLDEIVEEALYDEEVLSKKIQEIEDDKELNRGQILADLSAEFVGSWKFIISLSVALLIWMLVNSYTKLTFDAYPYIFLTLVLSCISALQAPLIMMAQNRAEEKDRRRSRSDYMLNLKAEMEIQRLHKKVNKILEIQKSQMDLVLKLQKAQIDSLTKIQNILEERK